MVLQAINISKVTETLMKNSMKLYGKSGKIYQFDVYPIGSKFNPVSGIYVFCKRGGLSPWLPLYIGQTQSFRDRVDTRLNEHDGYKRAIAEGASHIAVMLAGNETQRLQIESDLIQKNNPTCNRQGLGQIMYSQYR